MFSYNKVILAGNVTRDPELRYIPSGAAVVDLGIAVNDRRKNSSGEWIEETTFVDVTIWGRTAEVANEYLHKGSVVLIDGRLKLESWEKDGVKRSKLKVIADNMRMVDGKPVRNSSQPSTEPHEPVHDEPPSGGEDVPF